MGKKIKPKKPTAEEHDAAVTEDLEHVLYEFGMLQGSLSFGVAVPDDPPLSSFLNNLFVEARATHARGVIEFLVSTNGRDRRVAKDYIRDFKVEPQSEIDKLLLLKTKVSDHVSHLGTKRVSAKKASEGDTSKVWKSEEFVLLLGWAVRFLDNLLDSKWITTPKTKSDFTTVRDGTNTLIALHTTPNLGVPGIVHPPTSYLSPASFLSPTMIAGPMDHLEELGTIRIRLDLNNNLGTTTTIGEVILLEPDDIL